MTLAVILSLLGVGGTVGAVIYFVGPVAALAFAKRVPWQVWAGLAIVALLTLGYCHAEKTGETKGAAKVTRKAEKDHAKTVADAVADTGKAQATADAIGATTHHSNQLATEFVRAKIKELRDATDVPPAPAGAGPAVLDADRVSAPLNALIDGANRAAETADAQP